MHRSFLFALACAALPLAQAADLQVKAREAGTNGTVFFALYDQASFLGKPIAVAKSAPGNAAASFPNLVPGKYALTVFQDLNGNHQLDRNLVGAPTEPFGFSNDAVGTMGPPNFDAAAVQIGAENRSISITLR